RNDGARVGVDDVRADIAALPFSGHEELLVAARAGRAQVVVVTAIDGNPVVLPRRQIFDHRAGGHGAVLVQGYLQWTSDRLTTAARTTVQRIGHRASGVIGQAGDDGRVTDISRCGDDTVERDGFERIITDLELRHRLDRSRVEGDVERLRTAGADSRGIEIVATVTDNPIVGTGDVRGYNRGIRQGAIRVNRKFDGVDNSPTRAGPAVQRVGDRPAHGGIAIEARHGGGIVDLRTAGHRVTVLDDALCIGVHHDGGDLRLG